MPMSLPTFPLSLSTPLFIDHSTALFNLLGFVYCITPLCILRSRGTIIQSGSAPAIFGWKSAWRLAAANRASTGRWFLWLSSLPPSLERASDRERDRRSNPKLFDKFASRNREMRNCPCTQNDMPLAGIRLPRLFSVGIYYLISLYKADGVDGPQEMERK